MTSSFILNLLAAGLALILASCESGPKSSSSSSGSKPKFSGSAPKVVGTSARPVQHLPRGEYPFDARGNYISSWAAEGDRKYASTRRSSSSRSSRSSRSGRSSSKKSSKPKSTRRHVVKRGDTLWGISKRYGRSVSSIKSANRLRSDTIRIGQTLVIP